MIRWEIVLVLVLGEVIVVLPAANVCKKLPTRPLIALIGILGL